MPMRGGGRQARAVNPSPHGRIGIAVDRAAAAHAGSVCSLGGDNHSLDASAAGQSQVAPPGKARARLRRDEGPSCCSGRILELLK
jgi:hypothetical protein